MFIKLFSLLWTFKLFPCNVRGIDEKWKEWFHENSTNSVFSLARMHFDASVPLIAPVGTEGVFDYEVFLDDIVERIFLLAVANNENCMIRLSLNFVLSNTDFN